jgi:hypothetical protein
MIKLGPLSRGGAQPQALHYSWERAGHVVAGQPVPWCAETVVVEALVRLPAPTGRRKADFSLRLSGREPLPAETLVAVEGADCYRATFRLSPPAATTPAEVCFRDRVLGGLTLPVVSRDEFIGQLRLEMPTVYVRLGREAVACQTFVAAQSRGLLASAVLTSPTSLVPLLDLDLEVEFRSERKGETSRVPARLTASQLATRTALLTVAPPRSPRRLGAWSATWLVGDRVLAQSRARGISQRQFHRSLRIADTRFVVQPPDGPFRLVRQAPPADAAGRVGPYFLLRSGEPGMAGLCALQVVAHVPGAVQPPTLLEQEVLITDGPVIVAPGTLEAADLAQVSGFELRTPAGSLGLLPRCPAPAATFTSEGGFRPPTEFSWTLAAEEEMADRLNRLLDGQAESED